MTVHHETSDVDIRGILGFGLGLFLVSVAIHVVIWLLFSYFSAREARRVEPEYPLAMTQAAKTPPEPRLQTNPRQDLRDLREQEDQILGSYGWVDKNAGTVRIPIDEAIKLTLERGLPARAQNGTGR
ncbi:MAG: hypothetical protein HY047_12520 [Acidobacteria bacterium]|nr:hypothetical protein [Acidobacteriota bacterium]